MTTTFPINDQMYMEVDDSGAYRALHIEGQRLPFATAGTSTVAASRDLTKEDTDQTLICTSASAIVLTILNDATVAWSGVNAVAAYQGGSGAVSFAAGAGVTLRGTAPTATQYATQGVMRVGANEWAYL
jgi:hypothetical protein